VTTTPEMFDMRQVPGVMRVVNLTGGLQVGGRLHVAAA
jgi:hypothetical protein